MGLEVAARPKLRRTTSTGPHACYRMLETKGRPSGSAGVPRLNGGSVDGSIWRDAHVPGNLLVNVYGSIRVPHGASGSVSLRSRSWPHHTTSLEGTMPFLILFAKVTYIDI